MTLTRICVTFYLLKRPVRPLAFAGLFEYPENMTNRVIILVDGSNFYFKLKDLKLNNLLKLDFKKFAQFLTGKDKLVEACYYIGRIRQDGTKKTEKLFANQQKLIALLKKSGWRYSFGYLLKSDGRYHEKGVDVQMATDLLVAAYEKKCDETVLVSSDTDLSPAIKQARYKKLRVRYVGFQHQPSNGMMSFCGSSLLLTKEEIAHFIQTELFTGTIVGESLQDQKVLRGFTVLESKYSKEVGWHLYKVEVTKDQIKEISNNLNPGTWYAHFWNGDDVIVAFKNKTFELKHSDKKSWRPAIDCGLSLGIPAEQLDFPIE